MKIKYLGTAAAEGVPAIFCRCEVCRKSKAAGGRNIRTRSQSIIDDRLLLDFCPDTFIHTLRDNIDLISIKSCLITHAHEDHLYPQDIQMRLPECFANFMGEGGDSAELLRFGYDAPMDKRHGVVRCADRKECSRAAPRESV